MEAAERPLDWQGVITRLVEDHGDALLRYARLLCGDADDAADLVQDALVKTFGRLKSGLTVSSAEAYVRRAILTTHIDGGRRRSRWQRIAHLTATAAAAPSAAPQSESHIDLHGELARLSPRERACIVLRYYEDLKVDDVAKWLGISSGATKRYLSDGLAKLNVALETERREHRTTGDDYVHRG